MSDDLGDVRPVTAEVASRQLFGVMSELSSEELRSVQAGVLASERRQYGLASRLLFRAMDVLYGPERTLAKFRVLELVARVPYQAWESVAYVALTHTSRRPGFARRVYDRARVARFEQDNEQWHLLVLEELTADHRLTWFRGRLIPQLLAVAYYQLSWVLFVVWPRASYRLNADFEDHAAHEYALLVTDHPEWEDVPFESVHCRDYGTFASRADLFRQICADELMHRDESVAMMSRARFD